MIAPTIDLYHFVVAIGPEHGFLALPRVPEMTRRLRQDQKIPENAIHPWDLFELPDHERCIGVESNDKTQKFIGCRGMSKRDRHDDQSLAMSAIQHQFIVTVALEAKHLPVDCREWVATVVVFVFSTIVILAGFLLEWILSHQYSKIRNLVRFFPVRPSLTSSTPALLDPHDKDLNALLSLEAGLWIDEGDLKGTLATMV
mmetsp:Transcript_7570/g.16348  ORF Transcript_7570/g.16348 Transcript_7570/m.16348 type:complete len:200 (+) Transcript_7570:1729-2328(+)